MLPLQDREPMTRLASTSGTASSGSRPPPLLLVMLTGPVTALADTSRPPVLELMVTGPMIELPAHRGASSLSEPMKTYPVVAWMVTGPVKVDWQNVTATAPLATTGPMTLALMIAR